MAVYAPTHAFSWSLAQSDLAVTAEGPNTEHIMSVVRASARREGGFLMALYAMAADPLSPANPADDAASQMPPPLYEADAILAQGAAVLTASTISPGGEVQSYTVAAGDTVAGIAQRFNLKPETIFGTNGLTSKSALKIGQTLKILPVDGLLHRVRPGETVGAIAMQYSAGLDKVLAFNGLTEEGFIVDGQVLIIPGGKPPAPPRQLVRRDTGGGVGLVAVAGYFMRPAVGRLTQGLHAYNAVDIGANCGSPVYAAAAGTVVITDGAGWNGGYGKYVKISHPNGTQTLYTHLSKIMAGLNQVVGQGELIGLVGTTGRSTGCHVHFEVHGAANPFAKY